MSFLPSQGVSPSSLFGVYTMKLLGIGSDLSGGKVTKITKNGLTITKPDGKKLTHVCLTPLVYYSYRQCQGKT